MSSTRSVIVFGLVAVMLLGPLAPWALAQQNLQPEPRVVTEMTAEYAQPRRGVDVYDIGAVAATALKAPGNVATCLFGAGVSAALFLVTLGTAYKASTRVIEEGCAQKWVIRGDELRPGAASGFNEPRGYAQDRP